MSNEDYTTKSRKKRGTVTQMNIDLTIRKEYFAETGQIVYKKIVKIAEKRLK